MKFIREYVIRVEGETDEHAVVLPSVEAEARLLASLHATQFFADEVERFWHTSLAAREVRVTPLPLELDKGAASVH